MSSFGSGRVCVAGGCGAILSAYNPSSWCAVHDRLSPQARKRRWASRPTDEFWGRGELRAPAKAKTPADGWWNKPECDCGLCQAPSENTDAAEHSLLADAVQASPARSSVPLSLAEVRDSGLPALLLDFGESLLYLDGEIFEVDASLTPLRVGFDLVPLPAAILATGVGIDYGWRHAGHCECRFCESHRVVTPPTGKA